MKILYILKHNPWGIGGGCYACRNYLELFSELFAQHNIDILICSEYLQNHIDANLKNCKFIPVPPRSKFSQYLSPITQILHRHQELATKMLQRNHYDYCIFDHNSIAGSLIDLCNKKEIKTIVLNHNCELEYFKDSHHGYQNLFLLPTVRHNEKKSYLRCDYNIFLTQEDACLFEQLYGKSKTLSITGGCFFKKGEIINLQKNKIQETKQPIFVISGSMDNFQNTDGINYFLDSLYKYIPHDAQVVLTGKNPSPALKERINKLPNIKIIANPQYILDVVKDCDIYLCTTRQGGGLKLRIMDGIKCNLPIIAHKNSARGYKDLEDQEILFSFETESEFNNAIQKAMSLLKNNKSTEKVFISCKEKLTFEYKLNFFKTIFKS